MKGGVAVALMLAATIAEPVRDVTYVFYDAEEIAAEFNGLGRLARERPELLAGDFAILMEPSNAGVEAGCQGTMRVDLRTAGERAHSARSWMGSNAIHALAPVLDGLATYVPREVEIDGLVYREGLNAVGITRRRRRQRRARRGRRDDQLPVRARSQRGRRATSTCRRCSRASA